VQQDRRLERALAAADDDHPLARERRVVAVLRGVRHEAAVDPRVQRRGQANGAIPVASRRARPTTEVPSAELELEAVPDLPRRLTRRGSTSSPAAWANHSRRR